MSAFEQVIGRELDPFLKTAGFLRHGQTWNRRTDGVVQVISVQRSMNNTEFDSRFTINIGVTPDIRPTKVRIAEHECRSRQRIGFLRPERQDQWYRYRPKDSASVEAAIAEARADIEAHVLPYLSKKSADFPFALLQTTSAIQRHVGIWKAIKTQARRMGRFWPFN